MSSSVNKKQCVKCDAIDVVAAHWFGLSTPPSVSLGVLAAIPLAVYICCSCGFTELFVEQKDHLTKIREHAEKEAKKAHPESSGGTTPAK